MADVVTSQVLENGPRNLVMHFTCISDGTGETNVKKVDAADAYASVNVAGRTYPAGRYLMVSRISFNVYNMSVRLLWEATSNQMFQSLSGFGKYAYERVGGLVVPSGLTGATGSILLTSVGTAVGSMYTITLYMVKRVPQG